MFGRDRVGEVGDGQVLRALLMVLDVEMNVMEAQKRSFVGYFNKVKYNWKGIVYGIEFICRNSSRKTVRKYAYFHIFLDLYTTHCDDGLMNTLTCEEVKYVSEEACMSDTMVGIITLQ